MKLKWKTPAEKDAEIREWHDWYAWHPVNVGKSDYRWLETVQRIWKWDGGVQAGMEWRYRAKPNSVYEHRGLRVLGRK